MRTFEQIKL